LVRRKQWHTNLENALIERPIQLLMCFVRLVLNPLVGTTLRCLIDRLRLVFPTEMPQHAVAGLAAHEWYQNYDRQFAENAAMHRRDW
jgi:hypothetical protein